MHSLFCKTVLLVVFATLAQHTEKFVGRHTYGPQASTKLMGKK